jgi:ABC-type transport system involved in multi-copper enzyme maturation permease subunit
MSAHRLLAIAWVTWIEARRRRVVVAAVAGGLLFLLVYAIAVGLIYRHAVLPGAVGAAQRIGLLQFLTVAGLYVVNFLTIAVAILLPVDTVSGEIDSGVMQTLASKPIRRAEILLGKWLTYWLMTAAYLLMMAGGIAAIMYVLAGFEARIAPALPLMLLGATVMSAVTLAGGVRLRTVTNGMTAFAFYGIAFVAGWIEQIGTIAGSAAAQRVGTAISLVSPADAMWRRAAYELQPEMVREFGSPFLPVSVPSIAMIVWACAFVAAALLLAIRLFEKRPL